MNTVLDLNDDRAIDKLSNKGAKSVIFFGYDTSFDSDEYKIFERVSVLFKNRLNFLKADLNTKIAEEVSDLFGADFDTIYAMNAPEGDKIAKFKLDMSYGLTEEALKKFCEDYLKNDLKPYFKSQRRPKRAKRGIFNVLVGSSYEEFIKNRQSHVLVLVRTKRCRACRKVAKMIKKVYRKHLRGKFGSLVTFAKIDGNLNDIPNLDYSEFPSVFLYKKESTDIPPIQLKTEEMNKTGIFEFLKKELNLKFSEEGQNIKQSGDNFGAPEGQTVDTEQVSLNKGQDEGQSERVDL